MERARWGNRDDIGLDTKGIIGVLCGTEQEAKKKKNKKNQLVTDEACLFVYYFHGSVQKCMGNGPSEAGSEWG